MTTSNKLGRSFAQILLQTQYSQTILVESEGLLNVFTTSFDNNYNTPAFEVLLDQWQTQDLSSFPNSEILSNSVLRSTNATSKNQNYLSDRFLATAKSKSLVSEVATNNPEATAAPQVNFSVLFNDPSKTYSSYYNSIITNLIAAGEKWVNALIAPVSTTLTVEINFENIPTASGSSLTNSYISTFNSINTYEQGAAHKIRTGEDTNGALSDIEINFGPSYLTNELWFDPNPTTLNTPIPATKTDAYSVLLHEFGHVFAFNGWRNGEDGTLPGNYQSTFD